MQQIMGEIRLETSNDFGGRDKPISPAARATMSFSRSDRPLTGLTAMRNFRQDTTRARSSPLNPTSQITMAFDRTNAGIDARILVVPSFKDGESEGISSANSGCTRSSV